MDTCNKVKCYLATALLALIFSLSGLTSTYSNESFRISVLQIRSGENQHTFQIEVAETPNQRAQGLQWRKRMAPDQGMLFDFKQTFPVTMWMKNTYLSLDMFFIAENGTIINIARDTKPQSLKHINSAGPARGVLEVLAGTAQRLGIKAGDKVIHPAFVN